LTWEYESNSVLSRDNIKEIFRRQKFVKINNIESIMYGPFSQTFRIYKVPDLLKLSQNNEDLDFFGWDCISLKLSNRTVDFVIKDSYYRKMFVMAIESAM